MFVDLWARNTHCNVHLIHAENYRVPDCEPALSGKCLDKGNTYLAKSSFHESFKLKN